MKSSAPLLSLLLALPTTSLAQSQTPAAGPEGQPSGGTYTYRSEGRRDPFLSPLTVGTAPRHASQGTDGVEGLALADVAVRGVLQRRGALVAIVEGPDSKTHLVRAGDRLRDGVIKAVISDGLVVVQDVADPLSLVKQREVRKVLRSREDAQP